VTGVVCDVYHQTNSPFDIWRKTSGSGNTGWVKMTTGLTFGAALTKDRSPGALEIRHGHGRHRADREWGLGLEL
jgi:hypothetical protein